MKALILFRKPEWAKDLENENVRKTYIETDGSSVLSISKLKGPVSHSMNIRIQMPAHSPIL